MIQPCFNCLIINCNIFELISRNCGGCYTSKMFLFYTLSVIFVSIVTFKVHFIRPYTIPSTSLNLTITDRQLRC